MFPALPGRAKLFRANGDGALLRGVARDTHRKFQMRVALSVAQALLSHTRKTSSSVGPMPVGLAGDSENGMQFCKFVAGEVVTRPLEGKRVPPAGPPADA
jgi:hypothetical protein